MLLPSVLGKASALLIFFYVFRLHQTLGFTAPHIYATYEPNLDTAKSPSKTVQPISPRVLVQRTSEWVLSWDTWNFPFPITNAARTLEHFYDAVSESVLKEWRFLDPLHSFSVRRGRFELRFDCEESPIAWQMVSFVAGLMADEAENGWAGMYQIRLYNPVSRVMLRVALKLLVPGDGG